MLVKGSKDMVWFLDLRTAAESVGVGLSRVVDRGAWMKFTLRPLAGSDRYRRFSNTGRRINAACWHGHRDFMLKLFEICPHAILKTSLATYKGKEDFLSKFESTGWNNCGNMAIPLTYRHSCKCKED